MFDTHVHTEFSEDSTMKIQEVVEKSGELNLGVIITEHMDLNYYDNSKFRLDIEEYFKKYSNFRNNNILLGVEIGMSEKYNKDYEDMTNKFPFDYIIGSVHDVHDIDLYYAEKLYKTTSKKEFYEEYFRYMVKSINDHPFIDSLGHIDYISRYAKYDDTEIYYEEFKEFIDEVLKVLIDKGICIELNTRRLGDKSASDNLLKIYTRFGELGGKYITVGSDAHNSNGIAKNFNIAEQIIEQCNLKAVYFKNRKMQFNRMF
ncbi:histidinol phosphate phosphatase [Clostridium sp. ZS2-4]|uniref:histidinol phosphate phosphatase n=1 Tax=Clostridium sp. ZS2-4 TaxID=2987703 RepID=UPI00227B154A|nr:histidinol phosphate phosphatase [Clostridium sp. ZS2-4]MCY6355784.1 histidinol phosphate phosphatase [Clostridium sp. ZS2-4]